MLKLFPIPAPIVCIKVFISSFLKISSSLAFSVFITLPLNGRIAWVFRSLPCFLLVNLFDEEREGVKNE